MKGCGLQSFKCVSRRRVMVVYICHSLSSCDVYFLKRMELMFNMAIFRWRHAALPHPPTRGYGWGIFQKGLPKHITTLLINISKTGGDALIIFRTEFNLLIDSISSPIRHASVRHASPWYLPRPFLMPASELPSQKGCGVPLILGAYLLPVGHWSGGVLLGCRSTHP